MLQSWQMSTYQMCFSSRPMVSVFTRPHVQQLASHTCGHTSFPNVSGVSDLQDPKAEYGSEWIFVCRFMVIRCDHSCIYRRPWADQNTSCFAKWKHERPFRVPYSGIGRDSAGSRGMESGYLAEIGTAGSGNATGWDCFSEMRTFLIGNSLG